jgi:hypothetical protein
MDRFGCEQHELLVHQFLNIKQCGSLSDYIDRFSKLVDRLMAYESQSDPLYFTMRFIDGLHDDLRAAVLTQCPSCLDTAVVLAKSQDEVASVRCKEFRHSDYSFQQKPASGSPLSLPAPPLKPSLPQSVDR